MLSADQVKEKIQARCKTDPYVHVDISILSPKLSLKNTRVKITGAYAHIFQIEECSHGETNRHTFQYTDVTTGHIRIWELSELQ